MFACKSVCQRKSTGNKTCLVFSPLTLFFYPGMITWKGFRMLRSPLPQKPTQLPYNQTEVQQKCCQTTFWSLGLLGREQRKTCEKPSLEQRRELYVQKTDQSVITNLMVALLEGCRAFFLYQPTAGFIYTILIFLYLLLFSLLYRYIADSQQH